MKATVTVVQWFYQHELVAGLREPDARAIVRNHPRPAVHTGPEHDFQWCLAQANEIGPACRARILALLNDEVLVNLRGAQGIVRLRGKVGDARLEAACERELAHASPR
jgi:hypothetical protein